MATTLCDCSEIHSEAMLEILNRAILVSTALYDYAPRSVEDMLQWWRIKRRHNFPVVGAFEGDELQGFGTFGSFRAWPCYKYTVEHSLYVAESARRRGIGQRLLDEVISRAERSGFHVLVGAIDSTNVASIALHEKNGFSLVGRLPEVGFKFGAWLELCLYQRILSGPTAPCDG